MHRVADCITHRIRFTVPEPTNPCKHRTCEPYRDRVKPDNGIHQTPGGGIFNALTTSNEIPTLVSEKHFNPRQDLECSTGGAGRKPKHRPTCFIHRWRNFSAFGRELRFAALLKFSAVLGGFFMLPAYGGFTRAGTSLSENS